MIRSAFLVPLPATLVPLLVVGIVTASARLMFLLVAGHSSRLY
jgi:hypothetical protein